MTSVTSLLPDFRQFSFVDYVAHGFNIPPDTVLVQFVHGRWRSWRPCSSIGYLFLRTREVAQ